MSRRFVESEEEERWPTLNHLWENVLMQRDSSEWTTQTDLIKSPWGVEWKDVAAALEVDPDKGLSPEKARIRFEKYGPNELEKIKTRSALEIFIAQFSNVITALLAVAAGLAFAFDEPIEAFAILIVIVINALIGFWMEWKAIRAMDALRKLGRVETTVRRGGQAQRILADEIVPGDIIILEGGDVVTADMRLWKASRLLLNESILTGESAPVDKTSQTISEETVLAERINMVFKGTAVTRGSGEGIVVGTGMSSELGRISSLVQQARGAQPPIQKRLDKLGHALVVATLFVAALIIALGVIQGRDLGLLMITAIALAVATVPEGLAIVATISMARGMRKMAEKNALVRQLPAVETLGSTNVILTDKTGTLTENRMTVEEVRLSDDTLVRLESAEDQKNSKFTINQQPIRHGEQEMLVRILRVAVLCNNASISQNVDIAPVGDPLESALLWGGLAAGLDRDSLNADWPRTREEAFDSETKLMATFHRRNGNFYVAVKGAPEAVINASSKISRAGGQTAATDFSEKDREEWLERNEEMAREGLRVLAFAEKTVSEDVAPPYENLEFMGLIGLLDPPRYDVSESIEKCHQAGIRIVMITGDQASTAVKVGQAVGLIQEGEEQTALYESRKIRKFEELEKEEHEGLLKAKIFARATPEQKLHLIDLHQKNGSIVAMIGDGVNDAPALRKSDIGVAMGQRGTQIAREAGDMILEDDSFSTIVVAVEQGRIIFQNIQKFVAYLLSCNVSEVMVVGIASVLAAPLPILPLQILFLNLVTDVFPALALGVGRGDRDILLHAPRKASQPIISRFDWGVIVLYGTAIMAAVLLVQYISLKVLNLPEEQMITVCFLVLAISQLLHVFNMRENARNVFRNEVTQNGWVWGALALCIALLVVAVYTPVLSEIMSLPSPGAQGWALALGLSFMAFLLGEVVKFISDGWLKNHGLIR